MIPRIGWSNARHDPRFDYIKCGGVPYDQKRGRRRWNSLEVCGSLATNMDDERCNQLALTFPNLSVIAAQLFEAAFRARDGDGDERPKYPEQPQGAREAGNGF